MPEEVKSPKSGVQTTEFWITMLSNLVLVLQGMQSTMGEALWLTIALVVVNGVYTVMRSMVKANTK